MAATGRQHGEHKESGWGEERVAAMTVVAMPLHGRRAADEATSQMAGRRTMQQEREGGRAAAAARESWGGGLDA